MSILGIAKTSRALPPVRAWLYGAPSAGKTHLAKQFPDPILLSTDGNYVYETIPANSISKWEVGPLATKEVQGQAFINVINEIVKNPAAYKTVILDLVDGAFDLARDHFIKQLKITHEQDLGYGKAYDVINRNFLNSLQQLFKLPLNVILISHQATETIKPRNAAEYTVFKPSLQERYHQRIEGYCSLVARVYLDTGKDGTQVRKLSLSPKEYEYGINRLGNADDLTLTYGGDNYSEFLTVWEDLWKQRSESQDNTPVRNVVREQVAKDKAEIEKAEKADAQAELLAKMKKLKEEKPVVEKEVVEEPVVKKEPAVKKAATNVKPAVKKAEPKKEEVGDGEPEVEQTAEILAKKARIAELKAKRNIDKAKEDAKEKETASATKEEVGDGEPEAVRTESTAAKFARIRELQAAQEAKSKK